MLTPFPIVTPPEYPQRAKYQSPSRPTPSSARQSAHGFHATHARHHAIVPRENVAPPTCQRVEAIAARIRRRCQPFCIVTVDSDSSARLPKQTSRARRPTRVARIRLAAQVADASRDCFFETGLMPAKSKKSQAGSTSVNKWTRAWHASAPAVVTAPL